MQNLLLYGGLPRIAFAEPQAGRLQRRRAEASPGDELELMGQRIQQQDVSRVHPELAANLLEQHLQGHAQVQTAGDRLIDCVQGAQAFHASLDLLHGLFGLGYIFQAALEVQQLPLVVPDGTGTLSHPDHLAIETPVSDLEVTDGALFENALKPNLAVLGIDIRGRDVILEQGFQIGIAHEFDERGVGIQNFARGAGAV